MDCPLVVGTACFRLRPESTIEPPLPNGDFASGPQGSYDAVTPHSSLHPATPDRTVHGVAAEFDDEAAEERQHLVRDGVIGMLVGHCAHAVFRMRRSPGS
jgi:hypothetical protein